MKTADELNISQAELDGLIWVRESLRSGKFTHISSKAKDEEYPLGRNCFNMNVTTKSYECGSVGCIGGWVWVHMNMHKIKQENDVWYVNRSQADHADDYVFNAELELKDLYFPPLDNYNYNDVTLQQSAQAIDNYLQLGDPGWFSVLDGSYEEKETQT